MIRLKNSILPVWFQWDGDEASLEAAKQTIIDDIKNAGLTHYTTYVDIMDQPGDDDKDWDGISEDVDKESKLPAPRADYLFKMTLRYEYLFWESAYNGEAWFDQ